MRLRVVTAFVLMGLMGCAGLIVRPADSTGKKVGKYAARTVIGLATLGISEVSIDGIEREEAETAYLADLDQCIYRNRSAAEASARQGEMEQAGMLLAMHDRCANERADYYARQAEARAQALAVWAAWQGMRSARQPTYSTPTYCSSNVVMIGGIGTVQTTCY